jgi:hypothetical protein
MKMKELVSTIQSLLVKVEEGNITQAEMEQLVSDARELNERLIVLRYKVYEQGIFEVESAVNQETEVDIPEIEINIQINDESDDSISNEGTKDNVSLNAIELQFTEPTNQSLDNQPNMDSVASSSPVEERALELNFEEESDEEQILEESTIIRSTFDEETNSETQEIKHHQTSLIESEESTTIIETEETTTITTFENSVEENEEPQAEKPIESGNSETQNKLKSIEKSLRINYSIVPLETLIGSFTLNERLQFINELFEGSSDSFSTAVKNLDNLDGLDSARTVIVDYASTNNWDLESEIVEDFLVKICRRYA